MRPDVGARRGPVDVEGQVQGILSLSDVVTHVGAVTANEIVTTLTSICEHRHPAAVAGAA